MEGGAGGRVFKAGRLLTFTAFSRGRLFEVGANLRLGAYSNKYGTLPSLLSHESCTCKLKQN